MKLAIIFGACSINIEGEAERVTAEVDRFYQHVAMVLVLEQQARLAATKSAGEQGH